MFRSLFCLLILALLSFPQHCRGEEGLVDRLLHTNQNTVEAAITETKEIPTLDNKILRALVELVGFPNENSSLAVEALKARGPKYHAMAIPGLTKLLGKDYDWIIRSKAADALGKIGENAAIAVPALMKNLFDKENYPDDRIVRTAMQALASIGPAASLACKPLSEKMVSLDAAYLRPKCAFILGHIASDENEVIEAFISVLLEETAAIESTGGQVTSDEATFLSYQTRLSAARYLGPILQRSNSLDSEMFDRALLALSRAAHGKETSIAKKAIGSLTTLKARAASQAEQIIGCFNKSDRYWEAVQAVGSFGKSAVKPLLRICKSSNPHQRYCAVEALSGIGPDAADSLSILSDLVSSDPDSDVRASAAKALASIRIVDANLIHALVRSLSHADNEADESARQEVALALATLSQVAVDETRLDLTQDLETALVAVNEVEMTDYDDDPGQIIERAVLSLKRETSRKKANLLSLIGFGLVATLLFIFANGRSIRWIRMNIAGQKWRFITDEAEFILDATFIPESNRLQLSLRTIEATSTIVSSDYSLAERINLRKLRERFSNIPNGAELRIECAPQVFHLPLASYLTTNHGLKEMIIAGQVLRVESHPAQILSRKKLVFEGLGCVTASENKVPPLLAADIEVLSAIKRFRKWGATTHGSCLSSRRGATVGDVQDALIHADIVHLAAHAEPDLLFLSDGNFSREHVKDLPDNARARLVLLSCCKAGILENTEGSIVYTLVERGINVVAMIDSVQDYECRKFFDIFYKTLLPNKKAQGISLSTSIRTASVQSPSVAKSLVLFGDPGICLAASR